jgi:RNA recognition motif-containing protein
MKRQEVETSNRKIFVGAIESSVTSEELREYFQKYGNVKECVVLKNMNTNQSRGFGFVTFEDGNVAEQLVRENNFTL